LQRPKSSHQKTKKKRIRRKILEEGKKRSCDWGKVKVLPPISDMKGQERQYSANPRTAHRHEPRGDRGPPPKLHGGGGVKNGRSKGGCLSGGTLWKKGGPLFSTASTVEGAQRRPNWGKKLWPFEGGEY